MDPCLRRGDEALSPPSFLRSLDENFISLCLASPRLVRLLFEFLFSDEKGRICAFPFLLSDTLFSLISAAHLQPPLAP